MDTEGAKLVKDVCCHKLDCFVALIFMEELRSLPPPPHSRMDRHRSAAKSDTQELLNCRFSSVSN